MKSCFLISVFTCWACTLIALPLLPTQTAPLYEHLYEINDQWLLEISPVAYLENVAFANETERIRTHLQLVEDVLRKRPMQHLSEKQQTRRTRILDHLRAYWQTGKFPLNSYVTHRIPVFVDQQNTACAVGYLLRQTGEDALVAQIRAENNFADLQALLTYEAIPAWAATNGFTAEELAWIQPGYSVVYFDAFPFGNNLGIDGGQVLAMQVYNEELYFAGSFTAVDGHAATKITAWDGTGFRNFPGLSPSDQINKIAFDEATGDLYAIGFFAFTDEENPTVFARYHNGSWEALLNVSETEITATFQDLICRAGKCYLVGDFTGIKGDTTIQHLVIYDMVTDEWSPFNEELQFSGIIRTMDMVGDSLLLGGNTFLMEGEDTLAANIMLLNLAERTFVEGGSVYPLPYEMQEYFAVDLDIWSYNNSASFGAVGQLVDGTFGVSWNNYLLANNSQSFSLDEPPSFNGYYEPRNLIYGSIGLYGEEELPTVLISIPGEFGGLYRPVIQANDAVTAMADFQDELIIAGDFTEIDGVSINELTRANLLISDTEDVTPKPRMTVTTDGQSFLLQNMPSVANGPARFELFDMAGRQVWSLALAGSSTSQRIDPQWLPAGAYAYRLLVDGELAVGQVVLVR